MARARRRRSILGASLVMLALCLFVASDLTLKRVECSSDRWSKEGKRTGNKQEQQEVDFGQQDTFRTTWSSCNITGPCIRCSEEEEVKDPTSCRKTKHRHEITCLDGDKGGEARETFIMFESCKVDTPFSLGYFIGVMFMILAFSSPVVLLRKRRVR